jgi:threonine dehydrogenase-like Zn-dependent dehydrogenase
MIVAKVLRLLGPRALAWETVVLDPERLGPSEVLARTVVSAISPGTEVAAYVGAPPLRPGPAYPRLQGYCNVARVEAVGPAVTACRPGDLVLTHQSHRSAFVCGDAEILVATRVERPAALSVTYLFHLGYAALSKAGFRPGHDVAVVGLGAIGLGAAALASAFGGRVVAYSDQERARACALRLGAREARAKDDRVPRSADIVVTTANGWGDWMLALDLAARGGTVAVLGFPGRGLPPPQENPLASHLFYDKQLSLVACGMVPETPVPAHEIRFTLGRNMEFLADRILSGAIDAEALISDVLPADRIGDGYERLAAREAGAVTFALTW